MEKDYLSHSLRICTSQEMREIDQKCETVFGLSALQLMENAGQAAAEAILSHYPLAGTEQEIVVFAGKGNNGGDAFVVARRLLSLGRKVRVFYLEQDKSYAGASLKNLQILKAMKARCSFVETSGEVEEYFKNLHAAPVVVDGILGTGFKGSLDGIYCDTVELINDHAETTIALDIPTGIAADTGAIRGVSILAHMTLSFGYPKLGHFLPPGATRRGKLVNLDISIPPVFAREGTLALLQRGPLSTVLKDRDRYGHKNSFGHTLLVGGSPGRIGAICMAARACHRMGTGLVTVATWENCFELVASRLPDETMTVPIKLEGAQATLYKNALSDFSSIVIGPGLGVRTESKQILETLLSHYRGPLVIDADALNTIAEFKLHEYLQKRTAPTVLTPHPGEMSRLIGVDKEALLENPIASLKQAVDRTNAVVLLKGAATLIGSVDRPIFLNHYPNDGMATAGSGDVLAGMIGGLLGQGIDPALGTYLGVYLHSLAGDFAARSLGHRSMTAREIIENISQAFKEIKSSHVQDNSHPGRVELL